MKQHLTWVDPDPPKPALVPAAPQEPAAPPPVLEAARWPGGPPICSAENLPAFQDAKEADAYHSRWAYGTRVVRMWQCKKCGLWHYEALATCPSQDGHRNLKLPSCWRPPRGTTMAKGAVPQMELSRQRK